MLPSKVLEGTSANKAELAVGHADDRCRPRQRIDHSKVADDCTWSENRKYPLFIMRRCQADLEQTLVEPIATVACIPDLKKRVAGLKVMRSCPAKQLRYKIFGHAEPGAGN